MTQNNMATVHLLTGVGKTVACGANVRESRKTDDPSIVTCTSCRKSLWFKMAAGSTGAAR